MFGEDGHVRVADGSNIIDGGRYEENSWHHLKININVADGKYDVFFNDRMIIHKAIFTESVFSIERLSFRTGAYRTEPTRQTDRYDGGDLLNPGDPSLSAVYYIDEVMIK